MFLMATRELRSWSLSRGSPILLLVTTTVKEALSIQRKEWSH